MSSRDAFLKAVLGSSGAQALTRLEAVPGASDVVPPRAALAWLEYQTAFSGVLPGCPDISLVLRKADGSFTGSIGAGADGYAFAVAAPEHVAAAVCAFLGVVPGTCAVRGSDMARLGKTIDLLVKAQQKPAHSMAPQMTHETRPKSPIRRTAPQRGNAAPPEPPENHAEPTSEMPSRVASGSKNKMLKIRISDNQTGKVCSTCGERLFSGGKFKGCDCMAGLAKTVTSTRTPRGLELSFGAGWDREAVLSILEGNDE